MKPLPSLLASTLALSLLNCSTSTPNPTAATNDKNWTPLTPTLPDVIFLDPGVHATKSAVDLCPPDFIAAFPSRNGKLPYFVEACHIQFHAYCDEAQPPFGTLAVSGLTGEVHTTEEWSIKTATTAIHKTGNTLNVSGIITCNDHPRKTSTCFPFLLQCTLGPNQRALEREITSAKISWLPPTTRPFTPQPK